MTDGPAVPAPTIVKEAARPADVGDPAAAGKPDPARPADDPSMAGLWRDTRFLSVVAQRAPVILPMVLGGAVVASLAFEYGYFGALGVPLRLIPVKLLDIAFSATAWLGSLVSAILLGIVLEGTAVWWTRGRTLTEIVFSTRDPARWRRRFLLPGWICTGLGLMAFVVWLTLGGRLADLIAALSLLHLGVMVLAVDRLRLRGDRALGVWRAATASGLLILMFTWMGADAATGDVARARTGNGTLQVGSGTPAAIVRALADGAIATRDARLLYLPYDARFVIDLGELSVYRPGLVCYLSGPLAEATCRFERAAIG